MLPPPFLILPQAEINFNYFPSLAHDECQDNEALTLNKYVALGMCLVEQRTRAACAWWGLSWRASLECFLQGWQGWIHSTEWLWRDPWHHLLGAALLGHGALELGRLGFRGTTGTDK